MKRLWIGMYVWAALCVVAFATFVTGLELGHRMGYDKGWRDCKYDAKEALCPKYDDPFWKWLGSTNSVICLHRSFFE